MLFFFFLFSKCSLVLLSEGFGNVADIVAVESGAPMEESTTNVYWRPVYPVGFWVLWRGWWVEATHSDSGSHGQESCQFGWICWNKMRTFKNFPSSWVEVFFLPKLGSKQRWLLFAVKYSFLRIFFVLQSKWLLQLWGRGGEGSDLLTGEMDCPCSRGLEMTKNVSLFWLLNKMFRNFTGKTMKLFLYCGRISKTTYRVLT